MELDDADGNVVTASSFYANEFDGIDGDRSTGNRIEDNDIRENQRFGIHLVNRSVRNVVRGNTVTENGTDIVVTGDNVVEDNTTSERPHRQGRGQMLPCRSTAPPCYVVGMTGWAAGRA
jgi:parallel beta-helix repeat protein